jgi:hypothetical protein
MPQAITNTVGLRGNFGVRELPLPTDNRGVVATLLPHMPVYEVVEPHHQPTECRQLERLGAFVETNSWLSSPFNEI